MKYLSSDFLASYNEIMEELDEKQALIDTMYQERVRDLVDQEAHRLEQVIPRKFLDNEEVVITTSHIGEVLGRVVDSCISLRVTTDDEELDDYGKPLYGPGKFYPIRTSSDESVVTCEGMLRVYTVEREPTLIESDWGFAKVTSVYYEDELEKIG